MSCSKGCCPTQREHYQSVGVSTKAVQTRGKPITGTSSTKTKERP